MPPDVPQGFWFHPGDFSATQGFWCQASIVSVVNVQTEKFDSECRDAAIGSSPGWSDDEPRESSGTRGSRVQQRSRRAIDSQTQSILPSRNPTDAVAPASSVLPVATRLNRAMWWAFMLCPCPALRSGCKAGEVTRPSAASWISLAARHVGQCEGIANETAAAAVGASVVLRTSPATKSASTSYGAVSGKLLGRACPKQTDARRSALVRVERSTRQEIRTSPRAAESCRWQSRNLAPLYRVEPNEQNGQFSYSLNPTG